MIEKRETMETPIVELTRVLYHLDYFRRNFRQLSWHRCANANNPSSGSSCVVCSFKCLFTELSLLMRESVLDPPQIHHAIESRIENVNWQGLGKLRRITGTSAAHGVIYESMVRDLEEGCNSPYGRNSVASISSTQRDLPSPIQLHTEFNVTKICLQCRTTNYVEAVSQYTMSVDSSTLLSNDWPSFEFAIKTALDSEEFCVQPNCHGQTKVFRLLNTLPSILPICFTDPTPGSLITLLPSRLRPHLIFETSKSIADLHLKAVILHSPQWGYATLFHHSRLHLWIFIDSRRVLSLYKSWIESRFHPITYGFTVYYCFYCKEEASTFPSTVAAPVLPVKQPLPMNPISPNYYASQPEVKLPPVDSCADSRIYENWPLDSDSGQGSEFSSNCSSSTSASRSPSSSFLSKERGPLKPALIHETVPMPLTSAESQPQPNNKYATVRRKIKYQRRGAKTSLTSGCANSMSLSVPDLTAFAAVQPPPPPPTASIIRRPLSPHDLETSSRQSVDSANKKVSFKCEVTLVDDLDDEYIPHPIFQQVLEKLQKSSLGKIDS